jgi:hypothetical protein
VQKEQETLEVLEEIVKQLDEDIKRIFFINIVNRFKKEFPSMYFKYRLLVQKLEEHGYIVIRNGYIVKGSGYSMNRVNVINNYKRPLLRYFTGSLRGLRGPASVIKFCGTRRELSSTEEGHEGTSGSRVGSRTPSSAEPDGKQYVSLY